MTEKDMKRQGQETVETALPAFDDGDPEAS
jgi:hypothetical protein